MQTATEPRTVIGPNRVIAASRVQGTAVTNPAHENLGSIRDVVLDKYEGAVRYAVLEFGGFLGLGSKLFALPWELLKYDARENAYVLNVPKDVLKAAPGFNSDDWPDMGAVEFDDSLRRHYGLADVAAGFHTPPMI
jgi:hypothetical protein